MHISQNTSFCLRKTKFGAGLESGVWRREGMNKQFGQKGFLINLEMKIVGRFAMVKFLGRRGKVLPYRYLFRYP